MRKVLPLILLGLTLASRPGLFAAPRWNWSTSLDTIAVFGDTRYLMEIPGSPGVSSELIFPLSSIVEGLSFRGQRAGGRRDGGRDWSLEASVAVNLLAPFGKMQDYDWDMVPGLPKVLWSYTESDPTMLWLAASVAWKPVLAAGSWGKLEAALGYRLQYISQKEYGVNGWQYNPGYTPVNDPPSLLAMTYWVVWNVPTAGLAITLQPVPAVAVGLEAGLAVPYVADRDDHVLRYKLSTAAGLGLGGYADLSARCTFGKAEARVHPYLLLAGRVLYVKAHTLQTQTYYTGATEYPPGTTFPPVDHQISTRQFSAVLACGLMF